MVVLLIVLMCHNIFPNWFLEVIRLLKEPATFISFLTTTLGITGAYLVANYQVSKSLKYANPQYLQNFNTAQIYIRYFIENAEKIANAISTEDRINAKNKIYWSDFNEMENNLLLTIKSINPSIEENLVRKDFTIVLGTINEHAPPYYYKSMNLLIYHMIFIYDMLLKESWYLDLIGDRNNLKYLHHDRTFIKFSQKRLNQFIKDNKKKCKQFNLDKL